MRSHPALHDRHLDRADRTPAGRTRTRRRRRRAAYGAQAPTALARRPCLRPLAARGIDLTEHRVASSEHRVREAPVRAPSEPRDVGVLDLDLPARTGGTSTTTARPDTSWRSLHGASTAATREPSSEPTGSPNWTSLVAITRSSPVAASISTSGARVPRRLAGILRRDGDDRGIAAPIGLPDVQAVPGERAHLAGRHLDHPEPSPHLAVLPGIHRGDPVGEVSARTPSAPEPSAPAPSACIPAVRTRIREPSGDHACSSDRALDLGERPRPRRDRRATSTKSCIRPFSRRSDTKLSRRPSGDQRGPASCSGPAETCLVPLRGRSVGRSEADPALRRPLELLPEGPGERHPSPVGGGARVRGLRHLPEPRLVDLPEMLLDLLVQRRRAQIPVHGRRIGTSGSSTDGPADGPAGDRPFGRVTGRRYTRLRGLRETRHPRRP